MNTSKVQLYVEQFSLKTIWRLAERLFYNQGCKERYTRGMIGKEEKQSHRDPHPSRGHRRGGGYNGLGDTLWGARGSSHLLGTPALGSDTRKMSPLSWFENWWDLL